MSEVIDTTIDTIQPPQPTQTELGRAVGVSQRVIAYYETESEQPPGALLADLAKTLRVSADVLLGLKLVKDGTSPKRRGC